MNKKKVVTAGRVKIGGSFPVAVKGMIKTSLSNKRAVLNEVRSLEKEGCQILRVAVEKPKDAEIISLLKTNTKMSLEADVHFNYKLAMLSLSKGVDTLRLNPLNITDSNKVKEVVNFAKEKGASIRIGINSGGFKQRMPQNKLAQSMVSKIMSYVKIMEKQGFNKIIVSAKTNSVQSTVLANRLLDKATDYPLSLGLTATGAYYEGLIRSCLGLGILLSDGIGSALRVSLNSDSSGEVRAARLILQSLGKGSFYPQVISCPTCSRCKVNLRVKVENFQEFLYKNMNGLYNKDVKVALMGCPVNGPGEAASADIGIAFGKKFGVLFKKGKIVKKIKQGGYTQEIVSCITKKGDGKKKIKKAA